MLARRGESQHPQGPDPADQGHDAGGPGAALAGAVRGDPEAAAYRRGHLAGYGLGYRQALEAAHHDEAARREAWYREQRRRLLEFLAPCVDLRDHAER